MNRTITCIAIDDEPLALDVIMKFCQRIGGVEIKLFSDPEIGLEHILKDRPDLVFLDIEMEDITGLDIAARLPVNTCFIFTTAYLHYAVEGFNLDAVDYLHKPFSFNRFKTACEKAIRKIGYSETNKNVSGSIILKQDYHSVRINLSDILYVEAMEGYCKIFRNNGKCTVSRVLLKNIRSMLPENEFIRIHRSFIVAKSQITSFNKQAVMINSKTLLPIGRQYANDVISILSR